MRSGGRGQWDPIEADLIPRRSDLDLPPRGGGGKSRPQLRPAPLASGQKLGLERVGDSRHDQLERVQVHIAHAERSGPAAFNEGTTGGVVDRGGVASAPRRGYGVPRQRLAKHVPETGVRDERVPGPGLEPGLQRPLIAGLGGVADRELERGLDRYVPQDVGPADRGAEMDGQGARGAGGGVASTAAAEETEVAVGGQRPELQLPAPAVVERAGKHKITGATGRKALLRHQRHDPPERVGGTVTLRAAGLAEFPAVAVGQDADPVHR